MKERKLDPERRKKNKRKRRRINAEESRITNVEKLANQEADGVEVVDANKNHIHEDVQELVEVNSNNWITDESQIDMMLEKDVGYLEYLLSQLNCYVPNTYTL